LSGRGGEGLIKIPESGSKSEFIKMSGSGFSEK
jgi:hypothetical protein